jgi:hypothetical protein
MNERHFTEFNMRWKQSRNKSNGHEYDDISNEGARKKEIKDKMVSVADLLLMRQKSRWCRLECTTPQDKRSNAAYKLSLPNITIWFAYALATKATGEGYTCILLLVQVLVIDQFTYLVLLMVDEHYGLFLSFGYKPQFHGG